MASVSAPLHPLHAILLAFSFPLFLGALISDLAYWGTFQIGLLPVSWTPR